MRRKLELLLLLVVIGLAARSSQPQEQPLVRSFRLADAPAATVAGAFNSQSEPTRRVLTGGPQVGATKCASCETGSGAWPSGMGWSTQTFHLKVAPADKLIGFLQGQFRGEAVFTQTSEHSLTVRASPKMLQELASGIANLDRIPDSRLLPPPR